MTTTVAAISCPHGVWKALPLAPVKEVIATGTVYLPGLWMNETANRYSFQAAMKASRPVVTSPGAISGSSTL